MKWRRPGQPFEIEVAGVKLKCKPMTRGEALELTQLSTTMPNEDNGMELWYQRLTDQIISIDGFDEPPADVLGCQGHDMMLAIFKGIIGASSLTPDEVKNSKRSSDGDTRTQTVGDATT